MKTIIVIATILMIPAVVHAQDLKLDQGRISLSHGPLVGVSPLNFARDSSGHTVVTGGQDAGAGYQLTLSAWPAKDGNDRLHLSLAAMFGGGAQGGKTVASFTLGLLPGFGGFDQIPLLSIGPALRVPLDPTVAPAFEILATGSVVQLLTLLGMSP